MFAQTKTAEEYVEEAMDYSVVGNNEKALEDLNKAIQVNPKFISAYLMRGDVKSAMGDYSNAISDYNIAIEIEPSDPDAYKNRGNAKVKLNDLAGASTIIL